MQKPRDNLKNKFPRCHYNKCKKTKQIFETYDQALKYIVKMNLQNYTIYNCQYCHKFHIAH